MSKYFITIIAIFSSLAIYCMADDDIADRVEFKNDIEGPLYATGIADRVTNESEMSGPLYTATESDSIVKWAWDFPNYGEQEEYSFARRFTYYELSGAGEAYAGYVYENIPENNASGQRVLLYGAFRPIVLDFESVDIALGVSTLLQLSKQLIGDVNVNINDEAGTFKINALADAIEGHNYLAILSFSTLINFPDQALQLHLQLGQMWNHLRLQMNIDFDVNILNDLFVLQGTIDRFIFNQRDRLFFGSLEIRKFYDRNYLNFIQLALRGVASMETYSRNSVATPEGNLVFIDGSEVIDLGGGRQRLPPEFELQDEEIDINVVGVDLAVTFVHIETDFSFPLGNQGISLGGIGQIEHRTGEAFGQDIHGARITAGGIVSIFNILNIIATYSLEERNDLNNDWAITVVVGLYGASGVSNTATAQVFPSGIEPNPGNVSF